MGFFYYAFSGIGVIAVLIVSVAALIVFMVRTALKGNHPKRKIALAVAVFLVLQVISFSVLLYDFPEPSVVDIAPLRALGNARLTDFEEKQAALEETRYFLRKNEIAYNYHFQYWKKPSVELTIYVMEDGEEAHRNLLAAIAAPGRSRIETLSDSVSVYRSDARMWRGRDTFFDEALSRVTDTYFTIDRYLFILHEQGSGAACGTTTNEVIALICEVFF